MSDQVATKLFAISCKVRSQEGRYTHLHIPLCKVRHTNITSCSRIFWESFFQKNYPDSCQFSSEKKIYFWKFSVLHFLLSKKTRQKQGGGTLSDILQVPQFDGWLWHLLCGWYSLWEWQGKINFPRKITKTRTKMLTFTNTMAGEEYPPFNSLSVKSERLAALQDGKASWGDFSLEILEFLNFFVKHYFLLYSFYVRRLTPWPIFASIHLTKGTLTSQCFT